MGIVVAGAFALLVFLELRRPLRVRTHESKPRRIARNLVIAGTGGIVVQLAERPLALLLAGIVERRAWGLLQLARLPRPVAIVAGILLLDYTLYLWHVLTHRVPLLWRFHLVHHVDLDMDASTALRFHFGELAFSIPYRAVQVLAVGIDTATFTAWQGLLMLSILFHHSNVRLDSRLDRMLAWAIVTPRLHGIHHDAVLSHTDSNWSSGLTMWDRMHGTLRTGIPQDRVVVGVPAYRDPRELTAVRCLELPFRSQRDDWAGNPAADSGIS
jgi:sterol desaturase/sphingolipid hydroxylase (fatty acid hydroxylase superfamily)